MNQPKQTKGPMPENHLVGAILATLFCCLPFGIVAIVQAAQVNSAYHAGNYQEAQRLSESANTWTMVSVGIGLACGVIYLMAIAAGGM
jgi:hypothetical protein